MRVTPHSQTEHAAAPTHAPESDAPSQSRPRSGVDTLRRTTSRLVAVAVFGAVLLRADMAQASTHVLAIAQSVDQVFTNITGWLTGILAGLATVFLTIGGVRYLMAGGDPGEVEKAKTAFKSAGWGYGLAALAPLVVEILRGIVGA